ncbi:MAG: aminotransferase class I/II-fold pyridoxal phosphate-dependent enzyme [Chloroflexota bacterium]
MDLDELEAAARGAKLIAITNPNNPAGALLDSDAIARIAVIAGREGAWILADEVYRGLDQDGPGTSPSFVDVYPRTIAIGSMSKAFSLAGLRLGWLIAPPDVLTAVSRHRDYSVISVGARRRPARGARARAMPTRCCARNRGIVRANLAVLDGWIAEEPRIGYVKPASGTTALLRVGADVVRGVLRGPPRGRGRPAGPGTAFDTDGTVRIGYANDPAVLVAGLERTSAFLATLRA